MRLARLLFPVLILLTIGAVAFVYSAKRAAQRIAEPGPPKELPEGVAAETNQFIWSQNVEGRLTVEVRASNTQQVGERMELQNVELRLFQKDGKSFDRVRSARAQMIAGEGILKSDGEVEITMGLPAEGEAPSGRLLNIRSSGVRFEARTGRATTDRQTWFTFDRGEGQAIGAEYDPGTRELKLLNSVTLTWKARTPQEKTMEVSAGNLVYKEAESKVYLAPWSKLKKAGLTLDAAASVVTLKDGAIELVEAQDASGIDRYPNRTLEFAARQLNLTFHPNGEAQSVTGERNAKLVSISAGSRTSVTGDSLHMELHPDEQGSQLRKASAHGSGRVEIAPLERAGASVPETRILRSEEILLTMRAGGEEIEQVETHAPGSVEFIPNRPEQRHRRMNGERLWITYGPRNQIESFRAVSVTTRSEPPARAGKPQAPVLTSSRDMNASFHPLTGQMVRLEQWNDFKYEEGPKRAKANKAVLESPQDVITLEGAARVWDQSGTTSAQRIVMHQRSDEFEAFGNVSSTRKSDGKPPSQGGMLSGDEPVQAMADRMVTSNGNRVVRYEGNALLWQGANRIRADRIEIDRANSSLIATGRVKSELLDRSAKKSNVFTVVESARLVYSDKDRLAHYTGGAVLRRPGIIVESRELRALIAKDAKKGSDLETAYADGDVKIVQTQGGRTRTGTAQHAEYHTAEERVVLAGGKPLLVDSLKGASRGQRLTYFAGNDRLLVDGGEKDPAMSRIRRN